MESYLVENESILMLDDNEFAEVSLIDVELSLKNGRKYSDGRIDMLIQYGRDTFGIVELKLGALNFLHLEQLEEYMTEKEQLFETYIKPNPDLDLEYTDVNWVGVMVGSDISTDLREKIENAYQIKDNIPVAALTISRFRGEDNQLYVITDTIFKNNSRNFDRTKYDYNGEKYNKGRLVLAVIKDHVISGGSTTYTELKNNFPDNLQGPVGVFTTKEEALLKYERTGYKRFYINEDELLKLEDGNVISVSTQWGIGNINNFIDHARGLGYKIDKEKT
ncbi:hypothetical protein [Oceanobacillus picturae]|nr:hypothetical protein [Oceanobacillus picturae]